MKVKSKTGATAMQSERLIRKRLGAFVYFFQVCLDKLKPRYPSSSITLSQVFKMCADNWKKMDDSTKKRFQNDAYAVNQARLLSQSSTIFTHSSAKWKLERIRPVFESKRPLSPDMLFCKDWRSVAMQKHPTYSLGQISNVLTEMWVNSDEETKERYRRLASKRSEGFKKVVSDVNVKLQDEIKTGLEEVDTEGQNENEMMQ